MAFTINTNIASLQAQDYLRMSSDFQAKTINRVTSGLRIVNSGDDAAGLAIANSFRSDQAVLSQGIRNANDGLATLQTIDGGINNIGKLLDRARNLAAQSASGMFTGSRSVLDSEFQNVMSEIDRQAQAIGLNSNGEFAKNLSVFIGGGRTSGATTQIDNGSVGVDLSRSTVDTQSLGMKGVQASKSGYDLSSGATKVETIANDTNNKSGLSEAGYSTFRFFGPGFGDENGVKIRVNVSNVASTEALQSAVKAAIDAAGTDPTAAAQAFKNADIQAKIVTDSTGKQQLAFTSAKAAFQVYGGDKMANALLGDYQSGAEGSNIASTLTFGAGAAGSFTGGEVLKFRVEGGGVGTPYEFTYTATAATAAVNATDLQTQIANDATLKAAGITLSTASPAGMVFTSARGEDLRVSLSGDTANRLGMGAYQFGAGSSYEYNTFTTAADATPAAGNTTRFTFGFSGGAGVDINVAWNATNNVNDGTMAAAINAALNANDTARYAGIKATVAAGAITFTADDPSTNFRLQISAAAGTEDFGGLNTGLVAFSAGTIAGADAKNYIAEGSYQLGSGGTAAPLTFSAIYSASDDQALTVQANDASGVAHSLQIGLNSGNARSLDEALNTINTALQQSNDSTLKGITAVKVISGGVEKMTLISTNKDFRLSVGANASGTGFDQSSALVSSTQVGSGSNASISTQQTAQTAVTALANAVTSLGAAQAVVGKGQNQFSFAISLASTQLTNLAASESRIRDADLALEAANLTKAQVLQQAGIAALAQANSAPQAVLSLLRG